MGHQEEGRVESYEYLYDFFDRLKSLSKDGWTLDEFAFVDKDKTWSLEFRKLAEWKVVILNRGARE